MFKRMIALTVVGLLPSQLYATVVFSDAEFVDTDWTTVVVTDDTDTFTFTASQQTTGGNPGANRHITHQTSVAPAQVSLAHLQNGAIYDPSTQGSIAGIDFAIDAIVMNGGPSNAVGYEIVIVQNGVAFHPNFDNRFDVVLENTGWNHIERLGLTSPSLISDSFPGLHPDFSSTGAALQFGFLSANGTGTTTPLSSDSNVDNWQVIVHPDFVSPDFSDTEFVDTDWTTLVVLDDTGTFTFTASQQTTGGNPGANRHITHQTSGPDQVALAHIRNGAIYDPSTQGPIATIDFAIDGNVFDGGPSGGVGYPAAVMQNGVVFHTAFQNNLDAVLENRWTHLQQLGLIPSSLMSDGFPGLHPDFSSNGTPIQFGFLSRNGTSIDPISSDSNVDNWEVTVHLDTAVPAVSQWGLIAMVLLILTAGTVVFIRRRVPYA